MVTKVASCVIYFSAGAIRPERFTGALMPNITVAIAREDVSLWLVLPLFFKRRR